MIWCAPIIGCCMRVMKAASWPAPKPGASGKAPAFPSYPTSSGGNSFGEDKFALSFARIENHYFNNRTFLSYDGALLDGVRHMQHLPGVIIQGRYDVVTPPQSAFDLAEHWPNAVLAVIPDAGHTALEPGTADALVCATDRMAGI